LVQLADVEFYERVLEHGRLVRLSGVSVASLGHHARSITARINPSARALMELDDLARRLPERMPPWRRVLLQTIVRQRARLRGESVLSSAF
jgi:hypothetical protein